MKYDQRCINGFIGSVLSGILAVALTTTWNHLKTHPLERELIEIQKNPQVQPYYSRVFDVQGYSADHAELSKLQERRDIPSESIRKLEKAISLSGEILEIKSDPTGLYLCFGAAGACFLLGLTRRGKDEICVPD